MLALALPVKVVKFTAQALVEEGATTDCEGAVSADGKTIGEKGIGLYRGVELELGIGNNCTSPTVLILEDTSLQGDDWRGSTDGLHLSLLQKSVNMGAHCKDASGTDLVELGGSLGNVDRLNNEGARRVRRAAWWSLGRNGSSKCGKSDKVLHSRGVS